MIQLKQIQSIYRHFYVEQNGPEHLQFSICTNICRWLISNYFPEAVIMGYWHEDNPTAIIGEAEGGHDFIVIDNCIIDFWQRLMCDTYFPLIIPMQEAHKYYGNPANWQKVN